jgi:hypothetical protein
MRNRAGHSAFACLFSITLIGASRKAAPPPRALFADASMILVNQT